MIETRYGPLGARQLTLEKKKIALPMLFIEPPLVFLKTLLLKLGFLDGLRGLYISYFAAYNVYLKKLIRYREQQRPTKKKTVE